VTDFASIQRAFWRVLPPPGKYNRAAVVYDFLYRVATIPVTRAEADAVFRDAMEDLGVGWFTRHTMDRAVRSAYGITLDGFETRWRARTRRRYGALALVTDLAIVGSGVLGLLLPLQHMQRRRRKQRLEAMREAEAAVERARREQALEEILREGTASDRSPGRPEVS
jgi:hypothetical protein